MPGPIQSIERAAAILELLSRASLGMRVGEIASAADLAKPTTHGILATLRQVGYVEQDRTSGRYLLSPQINGLSARAIDVNVLRSHSMNWADTLAARTGEAVFIGAQEDLRAVVFHHVFKPDGSEQALRSGEVLPLHASALGKVILAFTPGLAARVAHQGLASYTRKTIVAPRELDDHLARIAARGWSTEVGELNLDTASIAAPIRDVRGRVVAAIALVGSVDSMCVAAKPSSALVTRVRETGRAISRELGRAGS